MSHWPSPGDRHHLAQVYVRRATTQRRHVFKHASVIGVEGQLLQYLEANLEKSGLAAGVCKISAKVSWNIIEGRI